MAFLTKAPTNDNEATLLVYRRFRSLGYSPRKAWRVRYSLWRFMAQVEAESGRCLVNVASVNVESRYGFADFQIGSDSKLMSICWGTVGEARG